MFLLFMVIGLVFLVAGGVGLFVTNINMDAGTHVWMIGNIAFSTFLVIGVLCWCSWASSTGNSNSRRRVV